MILFSLILLIVYAGFLVIGIKHLKIIDDKAAGSTEKKIYPSVSVIISFRNEQHQLAELLDDLKSLSYPGKKEFYLVDDHSEDNPSEIIKRKTFADLIYLPPLAAYTGKKKNIARAIQQSTGDIILTTDADCIHPPNWIQAMIEQFQFVDVQMVLGPVHIRPDNFFGRLQSLEFLSIMAVTRISVSMNKPLMANGANLAYRKSVFQNIGGFTGNDSKSSGDDQFLLRKVNKRFPNGIRFAAIDAMVLTRQAADLGEFFSQRIRWSGKWGVSMDPTSVILPVFVVLIQLVTLTLFFSAVISPGIFLFILILKMLPEIILLKIMARIHSFKFRLLDFLLVFILHPFYVLITAMATFFYKPVWKGRRIRK